MLKFYTRFEINDVTGDPLTDHDMTQLHYNKITSLQRAAFAKFPDLKLFALSNVASVDTRDALEQHFGALDAANLKEIASFLNLVPDELVEPFQWHRLDENFLKELLVIHLIMKLLVENTLFFKLNRFQDTNVVHHN